jgi:cytochrome c oxidase assembly protein subunit 15
VSVSHETVHPLIRRLATTTCVVALLPIGMGALVTTLKAGMAFADWPSSDGHNMLLYPWFRDFATSPEKFTEHGHRLAGMLIGFVSIILAAAAWRLCTGWVRTYAFSILVAVILQGLLGGARVLFDRQHLAMVHSITGASFFCMCIIFRLMCSKRWSEWYCQRDERLTPVGAALVSLAPVAILGQYGLGGLLRHLHMMLNEHLIGAVIAAIVCTGASICLLRSQSSLLQKSGIGIAAALLVQLLLGAGSYVTRFGLPMIGYVATSGSLSQAVICSLHTVGGMFLFASTVVSAVSMVKLWRAGCLSGLRLDFGVADGRGTAA